MNAFKHRARRYCPFEVETPDTGHDARDAVRDEAAKLFGPDWMPTGYELFPPWGRWTVCYQTFFFKNLNDAIEFKLRFG